MAAGATYEPIATTTLSSAASSVTFSSISGSYTDLVVITNTTAATAKDLVCRFNSDSGTNYSYTHLSGDGTSALSGRGTSGTYGFLDAYGYIESTAGQMSISHIMNYSNTTTYKTTISRSANSANGVSGVALLWRSTSAITSITFYAGTTGTNFNSGSTFALYGIAAA